MEKFLNLEGLQMGKWDMGPGVVEFPSGLRLRGRSWRTPAEIPADVCVVLATGVGNRFGESKVMSNAKETIVIDWPDFRLPRRSAHALEVLAEVGKRAQDERVEITSGDGLGRTGTAMAVIATLAGMDPQEAIDWVRNHYDHRAVGTHAQRAFVFDIGAEAN